MRDLLARDVEVKGRFRLRLFGRRIRLIFGERLDALRRHLSGRWQLWIARAELFDAEREHEHRQSQLDPGHILDGSEVMWRMTELDAIESELIRRKAQRLQVFIPDHYFTRVEVPYVGFRRVLTEEGCAEILPKIQEASRRRNREIGYWISLSIGLVGAISGLVAVIK